jgi:hypothetical protein
LRQEAGSIGSWHLELTTNLTDSIALIDFNLKVRMTLKYFTLYFHNVKIPGNTKIKVF